MQNIIILFVYSVASGIMNRLGGYGRPFNTKFRDWGCPLFAFLTMWLFGIHADLWWSLIAFLLMFGAMTTYWDKWGTDNVEWYEWALTGFFYGLSVLPIAIYTGRYLGFVIRIIILTVFMPLSNKLQFKVIWDKTDGVEFSRGFIYNITIPLLLI